MEDKITSPIGTNRLSIFKGGNSSTQNSLKRTGKDSFQYVMSNVHMLMNNS